MWVFLRASGDDRASSSSPQALPKSFHPQQLHVRVLLPNLSSLFSLWWLQPPRASLSKAACKTPSSLARQRPPPAGQPSGPLGRPLLLLPQSRPRGASGLWQSSRRAIRLCPGISSGLSPVRHPHLPPTPSLPSFLKLCSWTCLPVPAWLFRTVNSRLFL